MQLPNRYKFIGRKKFVVLPLPQEQVEEMLTSAIGQLEDTDHLVGVKEVSSTLYKFNYRPAPGKKNIYEDYCLLASVLSEEEGSTKVEYRFAHDLWMAVYTKVLAGLCFIIPIIVALLAAFVLKNTNPLIYIPLVLIATFALGAFIFFWEKKEKVYPIVDAFEQWLVSIFDKGE